MSLVALVPPLLKVVITAKMRLRAIELQKAGLTHITGLPNPERTGEVIGSSSSKLGKYYCYYHAAMLVTAANDEGNGGGEVWWGRVEHVSLPIMQMYAENEWMWVACCDGMQSFNEELLVVRNHDPYSNYGGRYSPIPVISD